MEIPPALIHGCVRERVRERERGREGERERGRGRGPVLNIEWTLEDTSSALGDTVMRKGLSPAMAAPDSGIYSPDLDEIKVRNWTRTGPEPGRTWARSGIESISILVYIQSTLSSHLN